MTEAGDRPTSGTAPADIYAYGLILCDMLLAATASSSLWSGSSRDAAALRVSPSPTVRGEVPPQPDMLITKATRSAPNERFADAHALRELLSALTDDGTLLSNSAAMARGCGQHDCHGDCRHRRLAVVGATIPAHARSSVRADCGFQEIVPAMRSLTASSSRRSGSASRAPRSSRRICVVMRCVFAATIKPGKARRIIQGAGGFARGRFAGAVGRRRARRGGAIGYRWRCRAATKQAPDLFHPDRRG